MKEYELFAQKNQERAWKVLRDLGLIEFWERSGCRVNLIGSLKMGLLVKHRDIDLHVYSKNLTEEKSFLIVSRLSKFPRIKEIRCINGLFTDEHCIAWHLQYEDEANELWQIDIIHIEESSQYDGYFERMADRIMQVMTTEHKETIMKLKFETPDNKDFHGVEYYEAVIADGVTSMQDFENWVEQRRKKPMYYWIP